MTTWSQIGVHLKPVILLNVNNFYSSLRDFINKYALSFCTSCARVSRRRPYQLEGPRRLARFSVLGDATRLGSV